MESSEASPRRISLFEFDAVIEQARVEQWRELVIIGPEGVLPSAGGARQKRSFFLDEPLGPRAAKIATLTDLTTLRISFQGIGPDDVRALTSLTRLTSLDLSHNKLGVEPVRDLAALTKLTDLDLEANEIGARGVKALATLQRLNWLDLGNNGISDDGARELTTLRGLDHLTVSDNQIGDEGACAIAELTGLTSLYLGSNQIADRGARALAALTCLQYLALWDNQVGDDGACALATLVALTHLGLSNNQIGDRGARGLAALAGLKVLNLGSNRISDNGAQALLDAWCDSQSSTRVELDLRNNRGMESLLLPEVLESQDAQLILAAYRRYREAKRQHALRALNEAKLLVVGNEAVGKTSLIRYLVHDVPRDPDEKKTPGAAIHEKIEVSAWSVHQSQVRLNVWDFGGQEIMRGTHRFFLTERSLYLLVLEDRREDDRSIYEWLELIAQRGGDSPVIVVVNKCDAVIVQRQLDEAVLREAYPTIAGFARTSCNPGAAAAKTIAALRTQIATTLSESTRLKHARDPIPQSWLSVKDAIADRARSRSVLPVRDFERLCEGDGIPAAERIIDPDEQHALLALLHDLGVVVAHGLRNDAPAIWRESTILDPNWLTGAIYALINSPTVRDQKGELRHDQLGEILLPTRYPARWHELILSMMQEPALGLCLPIAHSTPRRYLLPDALPPSAPDYGVWPSNALRFRFQYNLLPTGFIPRFIVEAHRSLTDSPTWWRTGVVLKIEGCLVLVRGDTVKNRVEIQVRGRTGQRAALSIVRNYFDAVHQYYAKLAFKARVPLPEQPEVDVGYDHLIQLEEEDGLAYAWRPEGANRKYTVRELLEGVRDDETRRQPMHDQDPWRMATSRAFDGARGISWQRRLPGGWGHDRSGDTFPATPPRLARSSASPYRGNVDFGILTVREDECEALLRRFDEVATEERHRRYRIRSLQLPEGGAYTLAVLRCLEQGNTDAQAATYALIEDLAPRFVFVVGIAGGVPSDEFSLGDVVVSNRVVDLSVEAVIRTRKREYALGGGPLHPEAGRIASDIRGMISDGQLDGWNAPAMLTRRRPAVDLASRGFYGDNEWKQSTQKKLKRHFSGKPRRPRVVTGAIASSDRLIKDDETLAVWLKIARQVVAVEMESAGIYKATHDRGVPFLAIRGISDVVGFRRGPDWTAYACETAASFARSLLLTSPIEPRASPDQPIPEVQPQPLPAEGRPRSTRRTRRPSGRAS